MSIIDEQTLGEALVQLTKDIATCIELFEQKAGAGNKVNLVWTAVGKSDIIPEEQMWRVSAGAELIETTTHTLVAKIKVDGEE